VVFRAKDDWTLIGWGKIFPEGAGLKKASLSVPGGSIGLARLSNGLGGQTALKTWGQKDCEEGLARAPRGKTGLLIGANFPSRGSELFGSGFLKAGR